jgi:hypothetical protein
MRRDGIRDRLLVVVGLALIVVAVVLWAWWYFVAGQRDDALKNAADLLVALVGAVSTGLGLFRDMRRRAEPRSVGRLADMLAQAVGGQWHREAAERVLVTPAPIPVRWSVSDLPVAGPVAAAVGERDVTPAYLPLPGQCQVTEDQLEAGGGRGELFAVYAGLASGRMVVVGAPGAGKSGTAVLLVLDALRHREGIKATERARVPVPVLFTAHGCDPTTCSVQDWLAGQLAASYPLFQHRGGQDEATALIAAGAVALILDGLDEMDSARRPAVLQALSDAPFRVVVLTRTKEMVQAAGTAWLVGALALHLHDVTGPEAADYLHRARTGPPPVGWTELLTHLREDPGSVLSRGLSNPLALTLIRDTYRAGDDVRELLDITEQGTNVDIERHLIARVLPVAYTARPGRPKPRYSLPQATQALEFLARQMSHDHTRDLSWWHIPRWAPTTPRILTSMLAGGLIGGIVSAILLGLVYLARGMCDVLLGGATRIVWTTLTFMLLVGLIFGLGAGLPLGFGGGRGGREPKRIRTRRAISLRSVLIVGLAYSLMAKLGGLIASFGLRTFINPLTVFVGGIVFGLPLMLQRDPLSGLGNGQDRPRGSVKSRPNNPVADLAGIVAVIAIGAAITFPIYGGLPIYSIGSIDGMAGVGNVARLLVAGIAVWFVVWFVVWRVPRFTGGFFTALAESEGGPQGPLESWRSDRVFGLVTGFAFGIAAGLALGLTFGLTFGSPFGHVPGLVVGLMAGLAAGLTVGLTYGITSSVTWATALAWRLQLQRSGRVPSVSLMPFLEDARGRGVLRTVGAVYQFRHATLHDHLSGHTTASLATPSAAELSL